MCKASGKTAGCSVAWDGQHGRPHQALKKFHVRDHRDFLPAARKSPRSSNSKARTRKSLERLKSCVPNEPRPGFQPSTIGSTSEVTCANLECEDFSTYLDKTDKQKNNTLAMPIISFDITLGRMCSPGLSDGQNIWSLT